MSPDKLRSELWRLPAAERYSMLMLTCAELDPNALGAVLNIIEVEEKLGQQLAPHHQSVLAGRHRLAAHRYEHRHPHTTIEDDVRAIIS
jgi:hypothetical protein